MEGGHSNRRGRKQRVVGKAGGGAGRAGVRERGGRRGGIGGGRETHH